MYVDKIVRVGYATVVEANGGENQLTILDVPRQDGRTWLTAVSSSVDGKNEVLFDELWPARHLRRALMEIVNDWHRPNAIGPDTDRNHDLLKFFAVFDADGFLADCEAMTDNR